MNFAQAETMFSRDRIRELAEDPDGLRYLKLRSLNRRDNLIRLFQVAAITPSMTRC